MASILCFHKYYGINTSASINALAPVPIAAHLSCRPSLLTSILRHQFSDSINTVASISCFHQCYGINSLLPLTLWHQSQLTSLFTAGHPASINTSACINALASVPIAAHLSCSPFLLTSMLWHPAMLLIPSILWHQSHLTAILPPSLPSNTLVTLWWHRNQSWSCFWR